MSSGIVSRGTIIKLGKFKGQINSRVLRCKKSKPCRGCEFCKHQSYFPSHLRLCYTSKNETDTNNLKRLVNSERPWTSERCPDTSPGTSEDLSTSKRPVTTVYSNKLNRSSITTNKSIMSNRLIKSDGERQSDDSIISNSSSVLKYPSSNPVNHKRNSSNLEDLLSENHSLDEKLVCLNDKSTVKTRKIEQQNRLYLLLKIWQRTTKLGGGNK